MNKEISILRETQRFALHEAKLALNELNFQIKQYYINHVNTPIGLMGEISEILWNKSQVEKEIKFLETELIEKKYANHIGWSDVNPFEVIEEKTPNKMIIRSMAAVEKPEAVNARQASFIPGGFCGHFDNYLQEWNITPNKNGIIRVIRKHKNNKWYDNAGRQYSIEDKPRKFYDFNF